jgi:exodeoxyribonuclease VII small subunit
MLTLPRKKCIVMSEQELSYEVAVKELQQIVDRMQSPECEVDEMCALTSRAVELLKVCRGHLTRTREDLKKLLENID